MAQGPPVAPKRGTLIKLIGWACVAAGLALAGADIFYPGRFLLWIGPGVAALGILVLGLAHIARRPPVRIKRPEPRGAAPVPRGPAATVGQTYKALTRFTSGRGRIRVGTASVGAMGDESIGPGDTVEVIAITDGQPKIRKTSPGA